MNTRKTCRICKESKKLNEFSLASGNLGGYNHRCKRCVADHAKIYYKTLPGLITHIYNNEKQASRDRGHVAPRYTKKELISWLYKQNIQRQYTLWENSGYLKDLRPSIDRLNSTQPYTMRNIRLVTWKENNDAAYSERKSCKRVTAQCRSIHQLDETGNIINTFKSIALASRETGIQRTNINAACSGKITHKAGGYYWKYKDKLKEAA